MWSRNLHWLQIRKVAWPSFSSGATPEQAEALYQTFIEQARAEGIVTQSGQFAADMQVELLNDGPVTFWLQV